MGRTDSLSAHIIEGLRSAWRGVCAEAVVDQQLAIISFAEQYRLYAVLQVFNCNQPHFSLRGLARRLSRQFVRQSHPLDTCDDSRSVWLPISFSSSSDVCSVIVRLCGFFHIFADFIVVLKKVQCIPGYYQQIFV